MHELNPIKNDVLLILDGSYLSYYCTYGAVEKWKSEYYNTSLETIQLPEPEEVPYELLPNLITDTLYFKDVLMEHVRKKLAAINNIVMETTGHFYSASVGYNRVDTLLAEDYHGDDMFRRRIYPGYKITRDSLRASRNQFNHEKVFEYLYSDIFPKLLPKPCHSLMVDGAEGDDVIACVIKSPELRKRYKKMVLISSDRDFCQLHTNENRMVQYSLDGVEVVPTRKYTERGITKKEQITAHQALLMKVLTGDKSDNIPGIKKKLGPVTAWKLIQGDALKNIHAIFESDKSAELAFKINVKLIDFDKIPKPLNDKILKAFKKKFLQET